MIHATAIVDEKAKLGKNVSIGPYSIIGPEVEIGAGTEIGPHVVIQGPTHIGEKNKIFQLKVCLYCCYLSLNTNLCYLY